MGNGLSIWLQRNSKYLIYFSISLLLSCNNSPELIGSNKIINRDKLNTGTLVCRLGNGYFSDYFRKIGSKEKKYSHIGIISKENNTLYVYHSEASELTGVGLVKRETLDYFLSDIKVYDFFEFNYSDSIKKNLINNVKKYHSKKTAFDLNFDSFDDNELYCTELIATSINKTLNNKEITPSLKLNGIKIFSLDDIYLNTNVRK